MLRSATIVLMMTAGMAACTEQAPSRPEAPPPIPAPEADSCDAARFADLIGQDAEAIDLDHAGPVRILAPDSMMTMDYRSERLNVRTDAGGRITSFFCG